MIVIKQHKELLYDPLLLRKRKSYDICKQTCSFRTSHVQRFYAFLGPLFNKINKLLHIYPETLLKVKHKTTDFLLTLSYEETENYCYFKINTHARRHARTLSLSHTHTHTHTNIHTHTNMPTQIHILSTSNIPNIIFIVI